MQLGQLDKFEDTLMFKFIHNGSRRPKSNTFKSNLISQIVSEINKVHDFPYAKTNYDPIIYVFLEMDLN